MSAKMLFKYEQAKELRGLYSSLPMSIVGHNIRVGICTQLMACHWNIIKKTFHFDMELMRQAILAGAQYHDLGKSLLLTRDEEDPDKSHPALLHKNIKRYSKTFFEEGPYMQTVLAMGAYHHERYDGRGYPFCLCRDEIPPIAQLCAIADTYDQFLAGKKPGRQQCKKAYDQICKGADTAFSTEAIGCFQRAHKEMQQLYSGINYHGN